METRSIQLSIGLDAVASYRRLSYTAWHAIAEFVDNSTQAYFDNRAILDEVFKERGERLEVLIAYDGATSVGGLLRVYDNSIGMSYEELDHAMDVGRKPANPTGRSRYGLGLKTAACWMGNRWSVRTKKLGSTVEHRVEVDVLRLIGGNSDLRYESADGKREEDHYTVVEIHEHNRRFRGRTVGKIKDFLRSMYRMDLSQGILRLQWNGEDLVWEGLTDQLLMSHDGQPYRKEFGFEVGGKGVEGWVGIFDRGGRAKAGFSILHSGRVVRGWPNSWRPQSLFGQLEGTNDLVNQRLVGEVHMDDFEVSHTKDDIVWLGDEQEKVEEGLREYCGDYREIAKRRRKNTDDQRGPSPADTDIAVDEFQEELESADFVDQMVIEEVPAPEAASEVFRHIKETASGRTATFSVTTDSFSVRGYLAYDLSSNDPYVTVDAPSSGEVVVVINMAHPHVSGIDGNVGLLNYLRHCTYDALAEWKALKKSASLNPDTIKLLKDSFLRIGFSLEMRGEDEPDGPDV